MQYFTISSILILILFGSYHSEAYLNIRLDCGRSSASKYLTLTTPTANIPTTCRYTIRAKSLYVCQLRVDFDINLLPPTLPATTNTLTSPTCVDDILQIGDFRLCGTDTNQHIYLPFNKTAGDIQKEITITTAARSGGVAAPSWNLRVTQLECSLGSPLRSLANGFNSIVGNLMPQSFKRSGLIPDGLFGRTFFYDGFQIAPNGCTQYYPQQSGTFTSFNYNNGNGVYPGNMRYAICFRRNSNTQRLQLTATTFSLGLEATATGLSVDANCYSQVATDGRSEDFLMIPQSTITSSGARAFYYCGTVLNNQQVSTTIPGPLSIVFNADNTFVDTAPETGFRFDYTVA